MSGLWICHAGVIASNAAVTARPRWHVRARRNAALREAPVLLWGVSARVPGGGARAVVAAQRDTLAAPAATRSAMRTGEGHRDPRRRAGGAGAWLLMRDVASGRPGWPGSSSPLRSMRVGRPLPYGTAGLAARMTVSRAGRIWGLIAVQAARRGGHVSAADACAAAVAAVSVTGGWLTAASDGDTGHLMWIADVVSEQLAELQLTLGEGPSLDASASGG